MFQYGNLNFDNIIPFHNPKFLDAKGKKNKLQIENVGYSFGEDFFLKFLDSTDISGVEFSPPRIPVVPPG